MQFFIFNEYQVGKMFGYVFIFFVMKGLPGRNMDSSECISPLSLRLARWSAACFKINPCALFMKKYRFDSVTPNLRPDWNLRGDHDFQTRWKFTERARIVWSLDSGFALPGNSFEIDGDQTSLLNGWMSDLKTFFLNSNIYAIHL